MIVTPSWRDYVFIFNFKLPKNNSIYSPKKYPTKWKKICSFCAHPGGKKEKSFVFSYVAEKFAHFSTICCFFLFASRCELVNEWNWVKLLIVKIDSYPNYLNHNVYINSSETNTYKIWLTFRISNFTWLAQINISFSISLQYSIQFILSIHPSKSCRTVFQQNL